MSRLPLLRLSLLPLAVLLLWLGQLFGLLAPLDDWLYAQLSRHAWIGPAPPAKLLLIERDVRAPPPTLEAWRRVLEGLAAQGARVIGVLDPPAELAAAAATVPASARAVPWIAGAPLAPLPGSPERYAAPLSHFAWADATGGVAPPRSAASARSMPMRFSLAAGELPAFAWLLAQTAGVPGARLPQDRLLLDFSRVTEAPPQVSFARVAEGGLIASLVADKVVLIAPRDAASPGIATPRGGAGLTQGQLEAVALETLLEGRAGSALAAPWQLLLLVLVTVAAWPLAVLIGRSWLRRALAGAGVLGVLLLSWLLLAGVQLWLAPAAALLTLILVFVLGGQYQAQGQQERLRQLVLEGAGLVDRHQLPEAFYASSEHWSQVASLVTQLLDLKRTIFLERVPNDHRVREVKSLNCSFSEIQEQRRDYERAPYTDAIAENGPILLERQFLQPRPGEDQYLIPLMLGGDIHGFWAFGVAPAAGLEQRRRLAAARELGRQVAELLYRRQRWPRCAPGIACSGAIASSPSSLPASRYACLAMAGCCRCWVPGSPNTGRSVSITGAICTVSVW